ncbi:unnamed protein product [Rhizoctonia solani]|uniref:Zn(2)-C6 fungal-type domain-containing protein n=1 Tax=Rhizoctonia solani TaxID=456999 RepID=A0A8H2WHS2_9AGAM|nr:unnamed protein product [Rhizoctonia solani]
MPPPQVRSRNGCSACRSKHKKCDETKPNCQRCESSGIQCPGYTFITCDPEGKRAKYLKKPSPSLISRRRNIPEDTASKITESSSAGPVESAEPIRESEAECSSDIVGSAGEHGREVSSPNPAAQPSGEPLVMTNSFKQPACSVPIHILGDSATWVYRRDTSTDHGVAFDNYFQMEAQPTPSPGSRVLSIQTRDCYTTHYPLSDFGQQCLPAPAIDQWYSSNSQLDACRDPEDIKRVMFGSLVPDRNLESNSLAFILESYAAWIQRTAYDPVRIARKSKDSIVKHYGGSVESRWTITLMANLIRGLAVSRSMALACTHTYSPIVHALQGRLRYSIAIFSSRRPHEIGILEATRVLDSAVNLAYVLGAAGNIAIGLKLMGEAAPIFRQLCPDAPGKQIHLQTLLLNPTDVLRDYAVMDIFSSVTIPRTMSFQYDTTIDPDLESSVLNFSGDVGIQWARGIPDQVTLVFARINVLYGNSTWDSKDFNELEGILENFVPVPTVSSEANLAIAKIVVQECWRQAAYIYLYMGLCTANAEDSRVIRALCRLLGSLNRVKPGRVPDSFITLCLVIAGIAARDRVDRDIILHRIRTVEKFRADRRYGLI